MLDVPVGSLLPLELDLQARLVIKITVVRSFDLFPSDGAYFDASTLLPLPGRFAFRSTMSFGARCDIVVLRSFAFTFRVC